MVARKYIPRRLSRSKLQLHWHGLHVPHEVVPLVDIDAFRPYVVSVKDMAPSWLYILVVEDIDPFSVKVLSDKL